MKNYNLHADINSYRKYSLFATIYYAFSIRRMLALSTPHAIYYNIHIINKLDLREYKRVTMR